MTSLVIALPGSLWPAQAGAEPYDALRLPILRGRVEVAAARPLNAACWSGWLMHALTGKEIDAPFGLCLARAGRSTATEETWMRADPVHCEVGREDVILTSPYEFALTDDEAREFIATLNAHFAPDGLRFTMHTPRQWLLRAPGVLDLKTFGLWAAINTPARYVPIEGTHARLVRKWMTEVQMILHAHPLNAKRQASAQPTINSIWPWGTGAGLPAASNDVSLMSSCKQIRAFGDAFNVMDRPSPRVVGFFSECMLAFFQSDASAWRAAMHELFENTLQSHLANAQDVTLVLGGQRPQLSLTLSNGRGLAGWWSKTFTNDADIANVFAHLAKTHP